jgi:uncharacterized protein YndB with AHSA1/START domain
MTRTTTDHAVQVWPDTIRFERLLAAPVERVWQFLVDSEKRARWFAAGPMEARTGGALTFTFNHDNLSSRDVPYPERFAPGKNRIVTGYVEIFNPPHCLAIHWGEGSDVARFDLTPVGDRTRLVITHTRLDTRENRLLVASGWECHTHVLAKLLTGSACDDFWAEFASAYDYYDAELPA